MDYTKLGRIRPVYSGEWNSGRGYTALEMVRTSDGGLSYIAQKDVPAGTPLTNGEYWAVVLDVREVLEAAENAADRINNVMDVKANALAATAEGNPVQIYPDKDSLIKPVLRFEPVQEGSGDPSPDNIRPIAGRTGMELGRCGKNLIPFTNTAQTMNGITFTPQADGRIYIKGTATDSAIYPLFGNWKEHTGISLPKGTNVKPNTNINGMYALIYAYMSDGTYKGLYESYTVLPETVTDAYAYLQVNSGAVVDGYFVPTLTFDGWSTEYEPYHGSTFTLDFGQTVYGGTLDWNKGELVVEWAAITDFSSVRIDREDTNTMFRIYTTANVLEAYSDIACSMYKARRSYVDVQWNNYTIGMNAVGQLIVHDERFASVDDFRNEIVANGLTVVYPLATPIIITLTPQQIAALAGLNTVYSDADGMTVGYNKDLATAFAEVVTRLAALETALTNA